MCHLQQKFDPLAKPRPAKALLLSMACKCQLFKLKGRWNQMLWSIVATFIPFCKSLSHVGEVRSKYSGNSENTLRDIVCVCKSNGASPLVLNQAYCSGGSSRPSNGLFKYRL